MNFLMRFYFKLHVSSMTFEFFSWNLSSSRMPMIRRSLVCSTNCKCLPWAMSLFTWDFSSKRLCCLLALRLISWNLVLVTCVSHVQALSRENLVLVAFVVIELFCWDFSCIACVALELWAFSWDFSFNRMCHAWAMSLIARTYFNYMCLPSAFAQTFQA